MRAQRQKIKLLEEAGADEKDIVAAKCKYQQLSREYTEFSNKMGLPQELNRVTVDGLGSIGQLDAKISGLSQDGSAISIPEEYDGNFDDFEPLTLSESEEAALRELHRLSVDKNVEYGQLIVNGETGTPFTSGEQGAVRIPAEELTAGTTILHSHTNVTPFSSKDFHFLLDPRVDKIGVIAYNNDVYMCSVGNGQRPTKDEFLKVLDEISHRVDKEVISSDGFQNRTEQERKYLVIREQAYQIARHFKWQMEGGRL